MEKYVKPSESRSMVVFLFVVVVIVGMQRKILHHGTAILCLMAPTRHA
jgi:hypothetical protein